MRLRDMLKNGIDKLQGCNIENGEQDARLLAMHVLELDYTGLFMKLDYEVDADRAERYHRLIEKRATHYPCQYITGTTEFMGYPFYVEPGVLIPRPETELLVEQALKLTEDMAACQVLDMCCGTGCIGIGYGLSRRKNGHANDKLTMVDISEAAINLSKKNSFFHNLECDIIKSDLFAFRRSPEKAYDLYDLIMTNPPYIRSKDIESLMEEVRDFEPRLALDGSEDGLYFYRNIILEAGNYLRDGGHLLCEIGYNQYDEVQGILVDAGFGDIELTADYAGLARVVSCRK
ncbi:MAG: peptide chain release factor N(5)-glutamine methyltransferase [Clostridium sp.]|nr:peptide chain release factor N(5)-glutamine methyltransferase [Clostridium sp.]MCM1399455.1 peptide chain release factor N(5)-glutamine methyltransferase [Clostridium sp.]MCM1460009.1 peptide chain release factor N(5)-glutamine methyltransferase [Bacteroides sp.]